jgi:hypothetical protein
MQCPLSEQRFCGGCGRRVSQPWHKGVGRLANPNADANTDANSADAYPNANANTDTNTNSAHANASAAYANASSANTNTNAISNPNPICSKTESCQGYSQRCQRKRKCGPG